MRKIIDGKIYDTETAKFLAEDGRGYTTDHGYWLEKLYRTKNGVYFLHGVGGPSSQWSESVDANSRIAGEDIRILIEKLAKAWVERHQVAHVYETIFGAAEEG